MVKLTFSLDDETVGRLRATAEQLRKPQSLVVREAIAEYAARAGRLSESERLSMLRVFDRLVRAIPPRRAGGVDAELRDLRAARRQGGRRRSGARR
jgi:hypothetical protein